MKEFLDMTTETLNDRWEEEEEDIRSAINEFAAACQAIIEVFGADNVARKAGSRSFNRAIFDSLIFYSFDQKIRTAMLENPRDVRDAYEATLLRDDFLQAIESDTAGMPNTHARFELWGQHLRSAVGLDFALPALSERGIKFDGFWG